MHFRDIIADSIYQRDWVTMIMVQNKYVFHEKLAHLKTQYRLLSDVILRLRNNIIIMYFDRYLSHFGIKIQIILANLYKLKIEY